MAYAFHEQTLFAFETAEREVRQAITALQVLQHRHGFPGLSDEVGYLRDALSSLKGLREKAEDEFRREAV